MLESRVVALDRDGLMQEQYYMAAVTPDDLACAGAKRKAPPPTTGGNNPTNPDLLPMGDIDWVCILMLLCLCRVWICRVRAKEQIKAEN